MGLPLTNVSTTAENPVIPRDLSGLCQSTNCLFAVTIGYNHFYLCPLWNADRNCNRLKQSERKKSGPIRSADAVENPVELWKTTAVSSKSALYRSVAEASASGCRPVPTTGTGPHSPNNARSSRGKTSLGRPYAPQRLLSPNAPHASRATAIRAVELRSGRLPPLWGSESLSRY